ncbi:multidrug effflux MFS transporter [Pseudonocardia eucalypti]|uniref:Multidrug effflux MFS transporter n=1 Tax=Pseudonocardia eucalypti TaxID=648755 RepID=A0ABP9PWD2_9PSEU|nr:DHA1 family bicyclomycin/chloramphenicol resistance-like MFS transporter [Pseudonocardia eucalypti]
MSETQHRGLRLTLILGSLAAFAPMSIDLYLPALPEMSRQFGVGAAQVQLTLTACLVGIGLGQLLVGPASDALGRRWPLMIGLAVYVAASIGCALAGSVTVLTGMRLVQGLAGGAGMVIARAVVRDLFAGVEMARFFSLLMLVNGVAPIAAPLMGSLLMEVLPWPALFGVLAVYGASLLVAVGFGLAETLPPQARRTGGLADSLRVMRRLLGTRSFMGYALTLGAVFAALFCYIAGTPFVLQHVYQLSPQEFGIAFGVNSVGIIGLGQLNRALLRRWSSRPLVAAGLTASVLGGLELLVATALGLSLPFVLVGLFVVVASVGLIAPNAVALALADRKEEAGNASALLGLTQFALGAAAAPAVGWLGGAGALGMGALMCGFAMLAGLLFVVLTRES